MEKISAVILCGGKSSRMGTDKADLLIGEETFLEHIQKNLVGAGEVLLSVETETDYPKNEIRHIADIYKECGPMAGIHAALCSCRYPLLFTAACDMPCIDWEMAEELYGIMKAAEEETDAVIPVGTDGKIHGLGGLYRKRAALTIENSLKNGERRVQKILKTMKVEYVSARQLSGGEEKLRNINTLEEYKKFMDQKSSTEIPVYSVVGYSGSGKTTFLEKLIPELKKRGLRVAVVKHDAHEFEIDREGKDSYRLTAAGADVTGLISDKKAVLMENRPVLPAEIIGKIDQVDVILTEGFKAENWPKILVYRKDSGQPAASDPQNCFAVVSDTAVGENNRVFDLNDAASVAGLIVQEVLEGWKERH